MPRVAESSFSEVHLGEQDEAEPVELDPERPFRILLVGDFSGRAWIESPHRSFIPRLIDRDNFDDVLEAMRVGVNLHGIHLSFREFEDFHPDRIYQAASIFQNLDQNGPSREATSAKAPPATPRAAPSGSLLDQMLEEHDPEPAPPVSLEDAKDLASFLQRITKGHIEPKPDPAKQQHQAKREALASELMRGILHHPRMQAIEAAWRALFLLVRRLETDSSLQLYVLDISLPELVSELATVQKDLRRKGPWAVIAANYVFGQSEVDSHVLSRLAALAHSLVAPLIAEAQLPKEDGPVEAWEELRKSPQAHWIGLVLPRFLLRLPFGKETDSVESFPFEEMPESEHSSYLWGNPAFLCAYLLGRTFLEHGWDMTRIERRIENLPIHIYREDGEPVAKPCAEVLMTEKDAYSLLEEGFMPLASLKHEPAAMIVRFQSIAKPLAPLAGLT